MRVDRSRKRAAALTRLKRTYGCHKAFLPSGRELLLTGRFHVARQFELFRCRSLLARI
jgi:hypothetical protein